MVDERELILTDSNWGKNMSAEDKPYANLCAAMLAQNVDDYKEGMRGFEYFGMLSYNSIRYIIPSVEFFNSSMCTLCCEFLGLGDVRHGYDVFQKVDRIYNLKKKTYQLMDVVYPYDRFYLYFRPILKALDINFQKFCEKYSLPYTYMTQCTASEKNGMTKNKAYHGYLSDATYFDALNALYSEFKDRGIDKVFFDFPSWPFYEELKNEKES